MPRPRFSEWLVQDTTTVAAGASSYIVVDQVDTFYPQFLTETTWATTASTTGLAVCIFRGYALAVSGVQVITYADIPDWVTVYSQPTGSSSNQTTRNDWTTNPELYPRYLKFALINLDQTNSMTTRVLGDR